MEDKLPHYQKVKNVIALMLEVNGVMSPIGTII